MGGVWKFLDFSNSNKSRKKSISRRHSPELPKASFYVSSRKLPDRMESPRRSTELPLERRLSRDSMYANRQLSVQESYLSGVDSNSSGTPIRSSIDDETASRPSTSYKAPSVIARLMGMDAVPLEEKPSLPRRNANAWNTMGRTGSGSASPTYRIQEFMPKQRNGECYPRGSNASVSSTTTRYAPRSSFPKHREHPQEEELQKFKKEFEAWQTNKKCNRSKSAESVSNFQKGREEQKLAEREMNSKKTFSTVMNVMSNQPMEPSSDDFKSVTRAKEPLVIKGKMVPTVGASLANEKHPLPSVNNSASARDVTPLVPGLCNEPFTNRKPQSKPLQMRTLANRKMMTVCRLGSIMESDEENEQSPSPPRVDEEHNRSPFPAKVLIPKPASENIDDAGKTCLSPETAEGKRSMNVFLEEVKERLIVELQGESRHQVPMSIHKMNGFSFPRSGDQCSSPKLRGQEGNAECFLDDDKERLKIEVQGKHRHHSSLSIGSLNDVSFGRLTEQCSLPEMIAQECNAESFLDGVKERLNIEIQEKHKHKASLSIGSPNDVPLEKPRDQCSSPELTSRECNMEIFLDKVKERLKMEVQGNPRLEDSLSGDRPDKHLLECQRDQCSSPELMEHEFNMGAFLDEVNERLGMKVQGKPTPETPLFSGRTNRIPSNKQKDNCSSSELAKLDCNIGIIHEEVKERQGMEARGKPGLEPCLNIENFKCSSPELVRHECNIGAILEAVKERLGMEAQGRPRLEQCLSSARDPCSSPELEEHECNTEEILDEMKGTQGVEARETPRLEPCLSAARDQCSSPELAEHNIGGVLEEVKESLGMEARERPRLVPCSSSARDQCSSPELMEYKFNIGTFLDEVKERLRMEVQGEPRNEVSLSSRVPYNHPLDVQRDHCSSPELMQQQHSMVTFLDEVTKRLSLDILGNTRHKAFTTSQIPHKFSIERPSDSKGIAEHVTRQVKGVSKELKASMMRPPAITSNFLGRVDGDGRDLPPGRESKILENDKARASCSTQGNRISAGAVVVRGEYGAFISTSEQWQKNHQNNGGSPIEGKTSSFREEEKQAKSSPGEISPRNFARSLSAPVSGASFERLVPRDQCMPFSTQVPRRQHEASQSVSGSASKSKRDVFNLKGKVSSLKHSLGLKGKFFSKKTRSAKGTCAPESDFLHVSTPEPSVSVNLGTPQDNLTEVPPSPASISSSLEEFGKPGQPSPISPLDMLFNGHFLQPSTNDICTNVPVENFLGTMEMEYEASDEGITKDDDITEDSEQNEASLEGIIKDDDIAEVSDQDEAYIRDVLVKTGLYGRISDDEAFPRWKMLCQPIPSSVFEEMEQTYKCKKTDVGNFLSDVAISRKLLFDLLNEALPCLLRSLCTSSDMRSFTRHIAELHGKKLLYDVWRQILNSTQALDEEPFSLEGVIVQDLKTSHWSVMSCDNTDMVAMDMESMVVEQMLDEFVLEFLGLVAD